jgi:plastocyanin
MQKSMLTVLALAALAAFAALPLVAAAADPQGGKAAVVEVRLSEYAIEMPHTLPAGPATFLVRNEGKKTHSFRIEGPGLAEALAKPVKPAESESLEVTLQPGEYKVYCPVGSHEAKGMTISLVVTGKISG